MRRGAVERSRVLLRGDQTVLAHLAQNIVGAVVGDVGGVAALGVAGVEVAARVVVIGAAGHAGEHGAFAQRQLAQLLAEVAVGRDLHAVIAAAQEDGVEVALQDLRLGVARFQLHGQVGLLQLALVALLAGEHGLLDELLGDGGAALRGAGGQVGHQRADDALHVHAVVLVKARVLHGDERVLQHLGDLVDGDHHAILGALVVGDQVALAVVDEGGLVLCAERGEVERRRGIDVRLGDADQRAGQRQTRAQDQQRGEADGGHQHAEQEVGVFGAGLEDRMRMIGSVVRLFFLAFFVARRAGHRRGHARGVCARHGLRIAADAQAGRVKRLAGEGFLLCRGQRGIFLWRFLVCVVGHTVPP